VGDRRGAYILLVGHLVERDHLEALEVDGRIVLQRIFKKCDGRVDCIDLTQDRDGWRALVNAVMNLRVS